MDWGYIVIEILRYSPIMIITGGGEIMKVCFALNLH